MERVSFIMPESSFFIFAAEENQSPQPNFDTTLLRKGVNITKFTIHKS